MVRRAVKAEDARAALRLGRSPLHSSVDEVAGGTAAAAAVGARTAAAAGAEEVRLTSASEKKEL